MEVRIDRLDENGVVVDTEQARRTFDPRSRAWFAGALQAADPGAIFWTEPYPFKTVGKLGITASVRWQQSQSEGVITIAAMDILLDALHQFMAGLQITPESQLVLLRNDGTVMGPMAMEEKSNADSVGFFDPRDLPDGPVKDALALWARRQDPTPSTYPFTSRKKQWWASFQPLQAEARKTWIGVLIPETDLIGNIQKQWISYALRIGVLLLLGSAAVGFLIRQYNKKNGPIARSPETDIEAIQSLIDRGENSHVEFKSTLRTNLKSGKRDKAIELAWLKSLTAFMNSEGGTLLVGVDDKGAVTGIGEDEFENDDKCLLHVKNLIHEHIGSEFARDIDCRLNVIEGKTVVSLTCRKSEHPIFLRVGQNESFFIRSGPSTTKLSMSKMVAYLNQRK